MISGVRCTYAVYHIKILAVLIIKVDLALYQLFLDYGSESMERGRQSGEFGVLMA